MSDVPVYPTWLRSRRVRKFWLQTIAIVVIAIVVALFWPPGILIALLALPFLYISIVLSWGSRLLGGQAGVQERIYRLLIDSIGPGGPLLDIGCGSGRLVIHFAKEQPGPFTGLDFWGAEWGDYSKAQAERNAQLEGVDVAFVHGTASALPFADASFGRVVSSMTFHEVSDVTDKTVSLREALRVLEPGGRFAFVDLFDDPDFYGNRQNALDAITQSGGDIESVQSIPKLFGLKYPLTLGKVLKHAVAVSGTKATS